HLMWVDLLVPKPALRGTGLTPELFPELFDSLPVSLVPCSGIEIEQCRSGLYTVNIVYVHFIGHDIGTVIDHQVVPLLDIRLVAGLRMFAVQTLGGPQPPAPGAFPFVFGAKIQGPCLGVPKYFATHHAFG